MEYSLSDKDFAKYLGKVPILSYDMLGQWNSIWELFRHYGKEYFILLYQKSDVYGHWVAVLTTTDGAGRKIIEVYDPYGVKVDHQFKFARLKPSNRYLSRLLLHSGVPTHYNHGAVQVLSSYINTCGRHVIHRLRNRHIELNMFLTAFHDDAERKGMSLDELVTYYYPYH